jgi:hypothetical protein
MSSASLNVLALTAFTGAGSGIEMVSSPGVPFEAVLNIELVEI